MKGRDNSGDLDVFKKTVYNGS